MNIIDQIRAELGVKEDESDEAALAAIRMLKAELRMAYARNPDNDKAMDIIKKAAQQLEQPGLGDK